MHLQIVRAKEIMAHSLRRNIRIPKVDYDLG